MAPSRSPGGVPFGQEREQQGEEAFHRVLLLFMAGDFDGDGKGGLAAGKSMWPTV
ncbi:hypothetical protein ACFRIB_17345 [Streptomyces mirabilis]|uniref:hypothetical protein n=1 Tax=Streptomyces mirabilis TaxID=68239 RepID=UPI0036970DAC